MKWLDKLFGETVPTPAVWKLMAACAVLLCAAAQWLSLPVGFYPADEWLRDRYVAQQAGTQEETRVVLIDIDEASLAAIGPWPWPRARIADLVEQLIGNYGVRGVALDLFFAEPADQAGDLRLAMLAQNGPLILAQAFDYHHMPLRIGVLAAGAVSANAVSTSVTAPLASGFIGNHAALAGSAKMAGNIGFVPDEDGVLRHLPLSTRYEGRAYPSLSKALLECCAARRTDGAAAGVPPSSILEPNRTGFARIPYRKALSAYTVIKAAEVLQQRAPAEFLRDALVIVGSSSLSLSDRVVTPLSASTSGFLVHAEALSAQLDQREGSLPTPWPGRWLALGFSIAVAALAAYAFPRMPALFNAGVLAAATLLWLALAYWLIPHDPFLAPSGPLLANLFLLAVAVPFGWHLSQSRSRRLLGTLQQYVARAVVDELLRSDLKDPLAPRHSQVTTLIADMEAYTSHVESLPIAQAAQLTTEFLECLTGPVLAKGGTLDKYTGDGLVAFWGAPLPIDDHADLALDAAIAIVKNVERLNAAAHRKGMNKLRVRIGIESGAAMAGDFGTSSRSIYTAVGDSVNVASRLEDVARDFPHDIVIGQGTVDHARRHRFQLLGDRILRGKELPTTLYTVELNG